MSHILKRRITIALLIDWLNTPYHMEILSGVADFSRQNDINLICFAGGRLEAPSDWEKNRNILFDFIDHERIDGLVVVVPALANYAGNSAIEKLLTRFKSIPIVTIGENMLGIPSVVIDNESGIRDVMKHIVEFHGYKRIAFISGLYISTEANSRLHAYKEMLDFYGLPYAPELIYEGDFSIRSGRLAIKELLEDRKVDIDAIISANDDMALGIIDEFRMQNKTPAHIIPVTGFDDTEDSKSARLTTVYQPVNKQAVLATELLIKKIRGENIPDITRLPTEIVIRESCGCYSTRIFPSNSESHSFGENDSKDSFENNKTAIITGITQTEIKPSGWVQSWLFSNSEMLFDALSQALGQKKSDVFLSVWNNIIDEYYESNVNLYHLHQILSIFRSQVIRFIQRLEILNKVEDLFQEARMMIGDALQKSELSLKILEAAKIERLNDFGAELTNTFDLEKQFAIIHSRLTSLAINSCYISFYSYPENPRQEAKLVFGYNKSERIILPKDGIPFKPVEIIPASLVQNDRRYTYILENMFHRTSQLGYIIMEYGPKDNRIYEILRTKINDSIIGTIMFEKIQKQAEKLEQQVRKRTSELHMMKFMKDKVENEVQKLTIHISQKQEKKLDEKSTIVYQSRQMQEVVNNVNQAVIISKPVLITGETGTGKELIAKLIHYTSVNKDKPFIAINCAAIPHALWEAELFGYVKGSFTDAKISREGSIELAGKGTLFLDEIGEMPLDIQSKLLRLLQENQYRPVGSSMIHNSKCRFVFATNRDVKEMVKNGSFREDLYYRINVFSINIPPIRERRDDIAILIDYFIKKYSREFDLSPDLTVEDTAMERIVGFNWPGNIREMENFIIRALAILTSSLGDKSQLRLAHFPSAILSGLSTDGSTEEEKSPDNNQEMIIDKNYDELLTDYSKKMILWALKQSNGRKKAAADLLGIKRTTLVYKIKEMNIE